MRHLALHVDGAARGNPGPAGIGVVIREGDRVLQEIAEPIGCTTNNVAEYSALIRALEVALDLGAEAVSVYTDSELLERQIRGTYRVRAPHLVPLHRKAMKLLAGFGKSSVMHVRREHNQHADRLSNLGADLVDERS